MLQPSYILLCRGGTQCKGPSTTQTTIDIHYSQPNELPDNRCTPRANLHFTSDQDPELTHLLTRLPTPCVTGDTGVKNPTAAIFVASHSFWDLFSICAYVVCLIRDGYEFILGFLFPGGFPTFMFLLVWTNSTSTYFWVAF